MTTRVHVTRAQVAAARAMVARSLVTGRHVSDSVRKIAGAISVQGKPGGSGQVGTYKESDPGAPVSKSMRTT